MMKKIDLFISRLLAADSPIRLYCVEQGLSYQAESLLDFSAVSYTLPSTDWLFFYSKNGVRFFLDQGGQSYLSDYKIACFGEATADYFTILSGSSVDYIGTGEKHSTIDTLLTHIKEESISFVQGENSLRSVQKLLPDYIRSEDIVVYSNRLKDGLTLSNYSIAIITSPMNYQGFIRNGGSANQYIAIGPTTTRKMQSFMEASKIGPAKIHVAEEPSEIAILTCLKQLLD